MSLLFSRYPLNIGAPLKLIYPATKPLPAEVDLQGWLATSPRIKIGIVAGRTYGLELDALIKQHSGRFYQLAGEDAHSKLWQMLQKGRLDAVIDYSARITILVESRESVRTSAIRGEPAFITGYLVCNRSAKGQQLIHFFNTLLQQPALQQQLLASYQQYFSSEEWQQVSADITKQFQPD